PEVARSRRCAKYKFAPNCCLIRSSRKSVSSLAILLRCTSSPAGLFTASKSASSNRISMGSGNVVPTFGQESVIILLNLMPHCQHQYQVRRNDFIQCNVSAVAERDWQFAAQAVLTIACLAVNHRRLRQVCVDCSVDCVQRAFGDLQILDVFCAVDQECVQPPQILFGGRRELDAECHGLRLSCLRLASSLPRKSASTFPAGRATPSRWNCRNAASPRVWKASCTRRYSTAPRTLASTKPDKVSSLRKTPSSSARNSGATRTCGSTAVFMRMM